MSQLKSTGLAPGISTDVQATGGVSPEQAQALVALCAQVLPVWARQLASSRSQSEAAVAEMLAAFAEIGPHLDMASQQVERLYKGFQYQDRISQMMTLLHDDIERLQSAMCTNDPDMNAAAWLAQLESRYVMTEQRQLHGDLAGGDAAATGDDETTFF